MADRVRRALERPAAATPAAAPHLPIPRADRRAVYRQGALVLDDGERLSVVVKNLSESGARVEYVIRLTLPAVVVLIEPTLRIRRAAKVVWQRDGVAGLAFETGRTE